MYDAIVIGARCAGSPTAMLLARKGYRVLLVDKAAFPSDIMSGHYIHQPGVARLKRWGLLDKIAGSNCPPVRKITLDVGPFALTGSPPPFEGVAEGYCVRRTVLDAILAQAAAEAGAELRENFYVEGLLMDDGRVTGIRGHANGGAAVTESARIVIGADGMHSQVARQVQARQYGAVPSLTCNYYTYWSGLAVAGVELYVREGRFMVAVPTNDGLTILGVLWPHDQFYQVRTNIEASYLKALELAPGLAERVRAGQRAERFVGTGVVPGFLRKPYGPGWALVGDAGYHKDPITAQGITDAFRDAELLVDAIDAGFSGRQPLEQALAGYEQRRNAAVGPMYEMTCQMASLEPPPPEMQRLFAALCGHQAQIDRYFGTVAGTVPIPEFFAQENIERILTNVA